MAMGLFSLFLRRKTPSIMNTLEITPLEKAVEVATRRVDGARAVYNDTFERCADKEAELNKILAGVERAQRDFEASKASFAEDPSTGKGQRVAAAKHNLELSQLLVDAPRKAFTEAEASRNAAARVVLEAEQSLANAQAACRVMELRRTASVDGWQAKSAPLFVALADALEAARAAAKAVEVAWNENQEASKTLRGEGIDCPEALPLVLSHLLDAPILSRVEREPGAAGRLLAAMNGCSHIAREDAAFNLKVTCTGLDEVDRVASSTGSAVECTAVLREFLSHRDAERDCLIGHKLVQDFLNQASVAKGAA
jgi:hypothetical protein